MLDIPNNTEEFALRARFKARVVVNSTVANAALIVRSLVADIAKVANKNMCGMNVSTWRISIVDS